MRLSEFKAFIEGLEHGFRGDAPSPEQWQLIKDKLHQVRSETSPVTTRGLDDLIGPGRVEKITKPDGWPEVRPYFGHEPEPKSAPFYPITPATDAIT